MKLLVISDLHLCDTRNKPGRDEKCFEKLALYIRENQIDAVMNLGDTVSRQPLLDPKYRSIPEAYQVYLRWKQQFSIPFVECAIPREKDFFEEVMGMPTDCCMALGGMVLVTMMPESGDYYALSERQTEFLLQALEQGKGKTVVIGTHIPYPRSCSRPVAPGIYLDIPEELHRKLVSFPGHVIWCGGHFHWEQQPPHVEGSLAALFASRIRIDSRDDTTYTSLIDSETGKIDFVFHDF